MGQDVLTLQEVADLLGKSTQTIRRMIKKGDLKAQRIRTAQGFQYGIYREQIPHSPALSTTVHVPVQSPIQTPYQTVEKPLPDEVHDELTSQLDMPREELVTREDVEAILENDFYVLEPRNGHVDNAALERLVETHHREKMLLIHILEALQAELREERTKPKSFFARVRQKLGF